MFALTRKVGQAIRIGDDIKITVLELDGNYAVKLAVQAPRDMLILRQEIHDRMKAEEFKIVDCDYED